MSGTRPFVVPHWGARHPQPVPRAVRPALRTAWWALRAACTPQNVVFAAALILGWAMLLGWSGPTGWQARLCGADAAAPACDGVQGLATGRSAS
ncbi:hypothetical protein [uncultured Methylobacterium sp.]|jgi:hypothetical protein|uniref:hypothetical protein n=1 Tax=uncultured Methylobacterium sp. TaxID=157278 RepID=UPI002625379E|nr:hypothetical protein [uncultured Methylobacterium sp.]